MLTDDSKAKMAESKNIVRLFVSFLVVFVGLNVLAGLLFSPLHAEVWAPAIVFCVVCPIIVGVTVWATPRQQWGERWQFHPRRDSVLTKPFPRIVFGDVRIEVN